MSETTEQDHEEQHPVRSVGSTIRIVLGLVIVAAIVALAVDNQDKTRVGWVVGDTHAPLALVLAATAAAGAIVGWL
ncbi:MAG: hypothetical protein ABJC79_15445, partial [Acidimicrobiia bacterium]